MKKVLGLAIVLGGLGFSAHAATLTPCDFGKFAGQVMPLPSSTYWKYRITTAAIGTSVTQAVPTKPGHIIWSCQGGTANWQQGWRSANTNPLGTAAPASSSVATDWEGNPVCRKLDMISGTTVSDLPNNTAVSAVDTSITNVFGSYCYQ